MNPTDCSGSKLRHFLVCVGAVLLSAGCAGVSMPAFPPAPVVAYEGARWPDADAVVIEEERELVYRRADAADGERLVAVMSHRVRLVVLTEGGLGRARVELPVDDYSSVVGVQARSVAKGGREVWLDSIDLTPRTEDGLPLEAGQVGAVRFKVPGVKIGSVIDYQYMRVFSEPDLVPVLVYGRDLPVLRSEISVIKPRDVRVDYRSGREGVVDADEQQRLGDVLRLGSTIVRRAMTPRTRMKSLPIDATDDDIRSMIHDTKLTRIPIQEGGIDSIAGILHVSGPLAMVVAGLLIGNRGRLYAMSEKTNSQLFSFWELIDDFLNAILFFIIGFILIGIELKLGYLGLGLLSIPIVLLIRLACIAVPVKALSQWFEFSNGAIPVMTWGGLRGGISIALALSLPREVEVVQVIQTITYVVVVFSIVVQGLTIGPLIKRTL